MFKLPLYKSEKPKICLHEYNDLNALVMLRIRDYTFYHWPY